MEVSSLFEDLAYSLEIAGHEAGLQHYDAHMLLDTALLRREYREWFVPEEWEQPFLARAEVSFEIDALAEARTQYTPEELAETLGLVLPDDYDLNPPVLLVDLAVKFTLDLRNWEFEQSDIERWHQYLAEISGRDKLESGLRNLRGEIRRALRTGAADDEWDPPLEISVDTYMAPGAGLVVKTLNVVWHTLINADLSDDEFAEHLQAVMTLVNAGVAATRAFQDEVQRDYEGVP